MTPERAPVVVIGSASRDVTTDDPRGWRLGGAVMYAGLALARLGIPTRILAGVDAAAATAHELALPRDAGADLHLVALARGPVFENRETPDGRIQTCVEPGDPIRPAALPSAWTASPAWLFGPVAGELDDDWAAVPPADAFVALGWQGMLRDLPRGGIVRRRAPRAAALVGRADLVAVSRDDLDSGTDAPSLRAFLRPDAGLLVTDGPRGGSAVAHDPTSPSQRRDWAAIRPDRQTDPTGAGDAFLAGVVAARLGHPFGRPLGGLEAASGDLRLGAAVASLTVEGAGLSGVPSRDAVETRLARAREVPPTR